MRKKMLLSLSLSLLILLPIRSESQQSRTTSGNEFGIDLTRTYTGDEVAVMLDIVAEEADRAIENAYQEGYKAAVLEYAPQNEGLRTLSEHLRTELDDERNKLKTPLWTIPLFVAVSFIAGWTVKAVF